MLITFFPLSIFNIEMIFSAINRFLRLKLDWLISVFGKKALHYLFRSQKRGDNLTEIAVHWKSTGGVQFFVIEQEARVRCCLKSSSILRIEDKIGQN